ncbi:hypothetical protein BCV69DRAFT_284920 [Microstroma glucosiphilum]|uniref:1-phosphatidylinositol 4-kinase n=1 Tax=Pseudomicrostroma glucosiphilum TaxID=1684307 RepID=A0A316U6M7_9BASI|nr:hypothetical protein BCV69DRAFT_284920 [Pseudomicrostroma glucosiphilum]PWN18615.1 hypothetical protein BCV69DRAFT_284920 [Pseudomicrostroma glucosiphilum]
MASLLLRLFDSDYFSPHLALSYLKTYSDNIGITYYLVYRLRTSFPPEEVEFYWPQLCHLLVTKPSESRALECFILERCEESVHVALLTLWHLQAALFDLSGNSRTPSFGVCKRVYNECQRILYDDPLSDASVFLLPSSSSRSRSKKVVSSLARAKSKILPSNAKSALVGMGTVLASVPGMPLLAPFSGQVAVEQGRAKPRVGDLDAIGTGVERIQSEEDADSDDGVQASDDDAGLSSEDEGDSPLPAPRSVSAEATGQTAPSQRRTSTVQNPGMSKTASTRMPGQGEPSSTASPVEQSLANISATWNGLRGKATAAINDSLGSGLTSAFVNKKPSSQQTTQYPDGLRPWHPQRAAKRPAARQPHVASTSVLTASATSGAPQRHSASSQHQDQHRANSSKSVPDLSSARRSVSLFSSALNLEDGAATPVDAVLSQYDSEARRRLLRSNYCRTQTEFLLSLQDISSRLLLLPKPARLSALRAELTALNHRLPAEVCFPLWCAAISEAGAGKDSENAIEGSHVVPGTEKEGRDPLVSVAQVQAQTPSSTRRIKHHRVVRINPSEAVVLNSADRAPYLLHVEILQNDLDFDPERRSNRESLKKLVVAEDLRRRKFALSRAFGADVDAASREALHRRDTDTTHGTAGVSGRDDLAADSDLPAITGSTRNEATDVGKDGHVAASNDLQVSRPDLPSRSSSPQLGLYSSNGDEEVDLTEQAFGSDLAAFGEERQIEEEDGDELAAAMNRHHDAAAWTEANSAGVNSTNAAAGSDDHTRPRRPSSATAAAASVAAKRKNFSLDEYSERMRTAAIMLAQLNQSTNASAQPAVTHNPHVSATAQGGWSSWIIGTSWATPVPGTTAAATKSEVGQGSAGVKVALGGSGSSVPSQVPVAPSLGGSSSMASSAGPSRLINTDTEAIRKRIMQEMMMLEEERMERMKSGGRKVGGNKRPAAGVEDEATVLKAVNKDDPSAAMFKETWAAKKARIRASSPYGHLPSWDVFSVIVKTGADLRQEQLAVQLINEFGRIWQDCKSRIWVKYFRILVTSENSGLMETITDAISVHSIKKEAYARTQRDSGDEGGKIATYSIFDHFVNTYGDPSSAKFGRARDRFLESLAGYSIISYLLQIKDRHNGNILLSSDGRIIHIDFGFMLGISPGGVGFEAAPFKLTQEYIDILGGIDSAKFDEFKQLMRQGFKDVRKHAERIIMIVELMQKDSKLPCFALGDFTASNLRDRFALALSASQVDDFVDRLVLASCASSYTRLYDSFQYYSQGIL